MSEKAVEIARPVVPEGLGELFRKVLGPVPETPEEMRQRTREVVLSVYGGSVKLDCTLTRWADDLADPFKVRPVELPGFIPTGFRSLMLQPLGVVDLLIEQFDQLGVWSFRMKEIGDQVEIRDPVLGHVVEVVPRTEENLQTLARKYGIGGSDALA